MNTEKYPFLSLDFVILDASALLSMDEDLLNEVIKHEHIYVSKTFNSECAQLSQLATSAEKSAYQRNVQMLKTAKIKTLPPHQTAAGTDTYATAMFFAGQQVDAVVISANKILVERMVLNEVGIYVYDTKSQTLHRHYQFAERKNDFEVKSNNAVIESGCVIDSGFALFSDSGTRVTLGSRFADGTEAIIYSIKNDSAHLAKIYKPKMLTNEKVQNIRNLISVGQAMGVSWCPFPVELLYSHSDKKYPVGYIMSLKKGMTLLSDVLLYGGDVSDILPNYRNIKISDTIELCIGIVQKIAYLNLYGVLITDFNDKNFALVGSGISSNAIFLDVDSFSYGSYLSNCRAQYSNDEYTRKYNFGQLSKNEAITFAYESLCIFIFRLLTLGFDPIIRSRFKFRGDRVNHDYDYRWALVPENMQRFFCDVFEKKNIRSVSELLYELIEARNALQKTSSQNKTYLSLCSSQIYVTNSDDLGETFTGLLYSTDESSNRRIITSSKESPHIAEEQWVSDEVLTFKRNSDGTYCIMSSANNRFLSVSGSYDNPTLSFSATSVSYSEKWRIEKISIAKDKYEHSVFFCRVGSESLPQLVLSVENNRILRMHNTYEEATFNNNLYICNVTAEAHCNDRRLAVYKPASTQPPSGTSSPESEDFFDKLDEAWEKVKDFLTDVFTPDGDRWDSIGKPAIIIAVILAALVIIFSSCVGCSYETDIPTAANAIDCLVESNGISLHSFIHQWFSP